MSDSFAKVRSLVHKALEITPAARDQFLVRECGDDIAALVAVRCLLSESDGSVSPIDTSAADVLGLDDESRAADPPLGPSILLAGCRADDDARTSYLDQLRSRGPGYRRYVLRGEIARGGMGVVQRAFDEDTGRHLALKFILGHGEVESTGDTPEVASQRLGRFLEEAQITSQLDHPGIVPVHEIGVDGGGRVYFTMKLVRGHDLRRVLEWTEYRADGWNETRTLGVLLRACEALAFAHDRGVVHRDLKPANIMVGRFGEVYVMDWGLARVLGVAETKDVRVLPGTPNHSANGDERVAADEPCRTMDGDVIGTPAYMSPEQARGELDRIGPRTDVYGIGAILYHLLTGCMPYVSAGERADNHTIWTRVKEHAPDSIAEIRPGAAPELVAICERAMARVTDDRYEDMTALADDLRAYLENRVVAAYANDPVTRLRKWVARNYALSATAVIAALLLVGLSVWSNVRIREQRDLAQRERDAAVRMNSQILRLKDKRGLDALVSAAESLWPARPDRIEAMTDWLEQAYDLLNNLSIHEATLMELRARGRPLPHDRDGEVAELRKQLGSDPDLASRVTALSARIELERDYAFEDDGDAWWHSAVRDLVVGLHGLTADDEFGVTLAAMEKRRALASSLRERTTTAPGVAARWREARMAIAGHSAYGGLDLEPQLGLIPLGPDPDSGLWEFAHVDSGVPARRDPDTGRLVIGDATSIVLVLLPGGAFWMGAQRSNPDEPNYDPLARNDESDHGPDPGNPVRVTLAPFFLSKYEMTQGQWEWSTGRNPSAYRSGPRHPVERVTWEETFRTVTELALTMPSEAQWEYACRAGTNTPWWTGDDPLSLAGAANVADITAWKNGASWPSLAAKFEFEDGWQGHAPVGSYCANAFGLHDVHGNVWEWCLDRTGHYDREAPDPETGARLGGDTGLRVYRGGGFASHPDETRCAIRNDGGTPTARASVTGVRPARAIDR